MLAKHTEIRFEKAIEQVLIDSKGFTKGNPDAYNLEKALFTKDVIAFINDTQSKKWKALKNEH